jgi:hypothetical protein
MVVHPGMFQGVRVFEIPWTHFHEGWKLWLCPNEGKDVIQIHSGHRFIVCQLWSTVMTFPLWGKIMVQNTDKEDFLHHIHVATSKENVLFQGGVNDLDVNQDHFSCYLYGDVLKNPLGLRWVHHRPKG